MANPMVAVLMGSASDLEAMQPAVDVLTELGVAVEVRVMSAHRTPGEVSKYASSAEARGISVLICGAGGAAHLAGVVAAHTLLPVIGVPLARSLGGLDSLYATVQMPPGVPVATVAIDGATNSGLLAAEILAIANPELREGLRARRVRTEARVLAADAEISKRAASK